MKPLTPRLREILDKSLENATQDFYKYIKSFARRLDELKPIYNVEYYENQLIILCSKPPKTKYSRHQECVNCDGGSRP